MERRQFKKTTTVTEIQGQPSLRELAEHRRMMMRRVIERLKAENMEANQMITVSPSVTWNIPKPPPGVVPANAKLAMDSAIDGYSEWAMQNSLFAEGLTFLGYPYLSELSQRPEYRVISETWAQELTRKGWKVVSTGDTELEDKADKLKEIDNAFKAFKVQEHIKNCVELDGFFGRGQLYIDLGVDTRDREELKSTIGNGVNRISRAKIRKGSLKGFKVIEPVWTYPNAYNANDPLKPDFFKPSTWFVMGQEIHSTRLLTFIGRPMPDLLKPMYSFGGLSLSQMSKPYVDNWLRTRQSVSDAISNFSIMVLLTDMASMLNDGALLDIETRADYFNALRDNRGVMLADKNSEDLKNVSMPISGLDHLQAQSQEHMCLAKGTLIETSRGQVPVEEVTTEDQVMTRHGYAPVAWAGITGYTDTLVEIETPISVLKVTKEHPVWSEETKEFVSAQYVGTSLLLKKSRAWESTGSQSRGAVDYGVKQKQVTTETLKQVGCFIVSSMKHMLEKFQQALMCTTKMKTQAITQSAILCSSHGQSTQHNMHPEVSFSTFTQTHTKSVLSVVKNLLQLCLAELSIALLPARQEHGEQTTRITNVSEIHTKKAEAVYNLKVVDRYLPEFFANGLLVHNCSVTQIPIVKLTGVSPSGLNATSDNEIRVFYDKAEAAQKSMLFDNLMMVLHVIQLHLYGEVDPEITLEFEKLHGLDDVEASTVRKTECDIDTAYINSGVISPQEARVRLASDKDSPYASLDTSEEALPDNPNEQQPGEETDEQGNKLSDLVDSEGHTDENQNNQQQQKPPAQVRPVSQGNEKIKMQQRPITSKPVSSTARDENPNHDPKTGEFASSGGTNHSVVEGAKKLAALPQSKIENMDWDDIHNFMDKQGHGNVGHSAYNLYEAQKIAPKSADKLKRVTHNNSWSLVDEYDYVANIDGRHYGISEYDDPDADDDDDESFVYAYKPLDTDSRNMTETSTSDKEELLKMLHMHNKLAMDFNPNHNPRNGEFASGGGTSESSKKSPSSGKPKGTLPDDHPLLRDSREDKSEAAQAERKSIVDKALAKAKPVTGRKPIIYIMGGGGAAGKSTLLEKLQKEGVIPTQDEGAVVVDPDSIKMSLKRYKDVSAKKDYRASEVVHEDGSELSKRIMSAARDNHCDVVYDATMSDFEKGLKKIHEFKEAGYDVHMFNVLADPEKAVERAHARYEKTGRYLSPDILRAAHENFSKIVNRYEHAADYFQTYNSGENGLELARTSKTAPHVSDMPVDEDGNVVLTHYSNVGGLSTLDPIHHGSGIKGSEKQRKEADPDNWVDRTYHGVGVGSEGGYKKETGLGNHVYTSKVPAHTLYDYANDPDNLFKQDVGYGHNAYSAYEKAIKDAGYQGYYANNAQLGKVAATFEPVAVHKHELAQDAWNPEEHPRGQPENKGEFAKTAEGSSNVVSLKLNKAAPKTQEAVHSFYTDFKKAGFVNPLNDREMIIGMAGVELHKDIDGTVHINFIRSLEQGKGHASEALKTVCDLADKNGVTLTLEASPMPSHVKDKKAALSKQQLMDWYGRYGFEPAHKRGEKNAMIRPPQAATMIGKERKVLFEVAPDPHNTELSARWNKLDEHTRTEISTDVLKDVLPEVLKKTGAKAQVHVQYGGYLDDTNPSLSLVLDQAVTDDQADLLTRSLGAVLDQDSMARVSKKPFKGSSEMGAVVIALPKDAGYKAVKSLYNKLRSEVRDSGGKALINGHTTDAGHMVILVDKGTEESIGKQVDSCLAGQYDVGHDTVNVAWPEKGSDNYGFQGKGKSGGSGTTASFQSWLNSVHSQAAGQLQQLIEQHETGRRKEA